MFDSPWFIAAGIAATAVAASVLPDRCKNIVAITAALVAVSCFVIGYTRRGNTAQEPPSFGTFATVKPFPVNNCIVVVVTDKTATAERARSCLKYTRADNGVTYGPN